MLCPVVSVVIPTHNRPAMMIRAVQSALRQTVQETEIIVVDDASLESTATAMGRLSDHRVKYERLDVNAGQGAARNRGISLARGEWIAFLDDDDEWLPRHLEGLLRVAGRGDSSGVVYRPYLVAVGGRVAMRRIRLYEGDVLASLASGWTPSLSSGLLVQRGFCADGYDESLVGIEDYDFWLQLASRTQFAVHPAPLVIVDKTPRRDRTNLGVARRLDAIDRLEEKWAPRLIAQGLGDSFATTCEQIRVATQLAAGDPRSSGRVNLMLKAATNRSVAASTRLSGILRLCIGAGLANAMQHSWFVLAGMSRRRVIQLANVA